MKRLLLTLFVLFFPAVGSAQTAEAMPDAPTRDSLQLPDDFSAKRLAIEKLRQRETARFDAADAQCQIRFAVNDCLKSSQTSRRAVMSDLRRQEARLNEIERARRGAEQVEQAKQKELERAQRDKEVTAAHADNLAAKEQKQREQLQKSEANRNVPPNHSGGAQPLIKAPSGPSPAAQAANRAEYDRRQAEGQQHRMDSQKRQSDKAKKPASSLPVPP
jgi:hypothetical protein